MWTVSGGPGLVVRVSGGPRPHPTAPRTGLGSGRRTMPNDGATRHARNRCGCQVSSRHPGCRRGLRSWCASRFGVSRGRRLNSTLRQAAPVRVSVAGDDLGLSNQRQILRHRSISWHRVPSGRVGCLGGLGRIVGHRPHTTTTPTNNRACLETPQGGPFPDARYLSETSPP